MYQNKKTLIKKKKGKKKIKNPWKIRNKKICTGGGTFFSAAELYACEDVLSSPSTIAPSKNAAQVQMSICLIHWKRKATCPAAMVCL